MGSALILEGKVRKAVEWKQPVFPFERERRGRYLLVTQSGFYQSLSGALGSSPLTKLLQCEAST